MNSEKENGARPLDAAPNEPKTAKTSLPKAIATEGAVEASPAQTTAAASEDERRPAPHGAEEPAPDTEDEDECWHGPARAPEPKRAGEDDEDDEPPVENRPGLTAAIAAVCGVVLLALLAWADGLFSMTARADILRALADDFTVAGVLLLCAALLVRLRRWGAFDGLAFAGAYCLHAVFPVTAAGRDGSFKDYYSFCQKRRKKEKKRPDTFWPIFLVGLGYLALAVIFTVIFMAVEGA
ncbi:MAG: DUF3899 domain-containing protein [Clostridia bacterium]|nr:DUF3899 domain-containing protein [Clostridia bacterium]